MNEKIQQIEDKLGNKVYVGHIAGTDTNFVWACVDIPGYRLQCPARTTEDAINSLFDEVMK